MLKNLVAALLCLTLSGLMAAARAEDKSAAPQMSAEQFLASLKFQQGKISLEDNIATLDLPASFRYLSPTDTARVLVEAWGNPPGGKSLGMIVPAKVSVLERAGWGVIITYDADGHVEDGDAGSIKYDELLKEMQESVLENNAERKTQGYPAVKLIGWAEKPSYDKQAHKLYWAKELEIDGAGQRSLNYNIRVLGRKGVLVLNAIAGMDQIAEIKAEMQHVTAFTDFTPGQRYADFDGKVDQTAGYGIAAMIAGGAAAKLGLFGKLFAFLLVFKKLILLALLGAGAAIFKFFGRKKKVNLDK